MITERGRVIAVTDGKAWIQTIRLSACQSCSARAGCGQRALAGVSGGRANQVLVANTLGAAVGDEVSLAIAESALLRASLLVYALPLLLMVVGAMAGHQWAPGSDAAAMMAAVVGLGLGFWLARLAQRGLGPACTPQLVRIEQAAIPAPESVSGPC
ncbi:MAG: SoxR reducing system RseC family protein [Marinobacter sp.]|uniref:SoxR reducing system RseC family protein n=1 Tax=Marinobacter sp. TaxID=50741 RepID=UPI00299D64A1|nr:SoxR reducing system RseC family protein [Marinobacter sp.]MDX1634045.1 SoxR reducing system RseC family protein [Marinobacter sp.]